MLVLAPTGKAVDVAVSEGAGDEGYTIAKALQLLRDNQLKLGPHVLVVVDEARKRSYQKRGSDPVRVSLEDAHLAAPERDIDLLALDEAMDALACFAPRKCRVVEMRFFGGLTIEETAAVLGVSVDIVKREWRTAKLWLWRALREKADGTGALESD